jgi:hypothetical protein
VVDLTFGKPYWEDADIREFDPLRDDAEFVWHRDDEDREIEIMSGEGWQFQLQHCLPWLLKAGMVFDIQGFEYHRLIRGVTPLKCRIIKNVNSKRTEIGTIQPP